MSKRFLIWIFAIGTILRLAFIWVAPFWYDENFTLLALRLPLDRMLAAIAGDVHPPLFYLVLWPLGQLVDILHAPIWILRLPSVLFSVLALVIFALILQRLDLHARIKTTTLVLMAVMPFQLYYAQEARMYTLLELLTLLAFLAMLMRRWGVFGLSLALMLYTMNYAMFFVPVLGLIALVKFPSDRKSVIIAGALACLAFLPWLLILMGQMTNIQDNYWMRMTTPGLPLLILFRVVFMPQGIATLQIPLMLACFAWLTIALIFLIRDHQWKQWYIAALAFVPLVMASIVSALWQPILHYRPLIGSTPFLYVLLAYPVNAFFRVDSDPEPVQFFHLFDGYITRWRYHTLKLRSALYAACFLVPALLIANIGIYLYASENKINDASAEMLVYLHTHWQAGDVVLDTSDDNWVNTAPYSNLPRYRVPGCDLQQGELSAPTRRALGVVYLTGQVEFTRAWVPITITPLDNGSAQCVADVLGLDLSAPTVLLVENENLFSGLWLIQGTYAQR